MDRRPPERLVVGRIVKPHGIRGELVVEPLTDAPDRFAPGARVGVGDPDHRPPTYTVESARPHQGRLIVRFREIADRDGAESARGALVSIPIDQAMRPPEGSYYPHEIEGLEVVDEQGARIGVVQAVLAAAANDVWVVDAGGREVALPAVREVIVSVDVRARRIVVRPQPGMLE